MAIAAAYGWKLGLLGSIECLELSGIVKAARRDVALMGSKQCTRIERSLGIVIVCYGGLDNSSGNDRTIYTTEFR